MIYLYILAAYLIGSFILSMFFIGDMFFKQKFLSRFSLILYIEKRITIVLAWPFLILIITFFTVIGYLEIAVIRVMDAIIIFWNDRMRDLSDLVVPVIEKRLHRTIDYDPVYEDPHDAI